MTTEASIGGQLDGNAIDMHVQWWKQEVMGKEFFHIIVMYMYIYIEGKRCRTARAALAAAGRSPGRQKTWEGMVEHHGHIHQVSVIYTASSQLCVLKKRTGKE